MGDHAVDLRFSFDEAEHGIEWPRALKDPVICSDFGLTSNPVETSLASNGVRRT